MTVTFRQTKASEVLAHLESEYGIEVPKPFTVEFGTPYTSREEEGIVGFASFHADYPAVDEECRRKLKAAFELDVPWWQKDNDSDRGSKDIEGKRDMMGWEVRVHLKGAFVCTITGQKAKPASQYCLDKAQELRELTPEQLTYLVALEVARLEAPGVSYDVECKPA